MSEAMERTCANCVHHECKGELYQCKLGVNPISGKSVYSQQVRNCLQPKDILYHSKVTAPCGLKGLYWEDGRRKRETKWNPEIMGAEPPETWGRGPKREANQLLNDVNGEYNLEQFQREHESAKRMAHLKEERERREKLAAEVLNEPQDWPFAKSVEVMDGADDGVVLTSMEHPERRAPDDLLVKALGDSFAEDKWSKPFKMAEE